MEKEVLTLDGAWTFKEFPETARRMRDLDGAGWMEATVPASIFTCLAEAGCIDPATLTARPEDVQWVSAKSWIFRKTFDVEPGLLSKQRLALVFDGLDTVCQIWLNDKLLGKTDNMFIPHAFDITGRLKPAGNVLTVKFEAALDRAEQRMQRYGRLSEHHFGDSRPSYIRKAQYQFGSVMNPPMIGCGIFRAVRIEGFTDARIENLHIRTVDCSRQSADIRIAVSLERIQTPSRLRAVLQITGHGLSLSQNVSFAPQEEQHAILIRIDNPALWWPAGCGDQPLYHLRAELYREDCRLDAVETDFGIRTVRVDRSVDKDASRFQFVVNEEPIYINGANWMPLSLWPGRTGADDYAALLQQAAEAHLNMLRVWAGGYYEDPAFYALCDRLGILVWQDFMFAAAYYPDRGWFTETVSLEARRVIERLRNHPCLALWCGNSRIDLLHEAGRLGTGRKFYGKALYHELLPSLLNELDPDREYIPTTPFSDNRSADFNAPTFGTTHNWTVWNGYADAADYEPPEPQTPRFVAEFGLQSLPDLHTVALFETTGRPGIRDLDRHHYQPGGPQRIARYTADDFAAAADLPTAIRQSQLAQARIVRRHVEYLRSHAPANSGSLIWTFNEPAAAVGFSMLDFCGRPKALYYYARRFFAPVLAVLTPPGATASPGIVVINDRPEQVTAALECRLLDLRGNVMDRVELPASLAPRSRPRRYAIPKSLLRLQERTDSLIHLRLFDADTCYAENICFLTPDKYLQVPPGTVSLQIAVTAVDTWQVTLTADRVFRDVQLIPPQPGRLSDNFLTLLPDCPQTVTIRYADAAPSPRIPLQILAD